jgi:hypothetical protein
LATYPAIFKDHESNHVVDTLEEGGGCHLFSGGIGRGFGLTDPEVLSRSSDSFHGECTNHMQTNEGKYRRGAHILSSLKAVIPPDEGF